MTIYRGVGGSIPSEVESTIIPVSQGGTGATTIAEARLNINAAKSGINSDITQLLGLEVPLSVTQGGTGANNVSQARSNLDAAQKGANTDITSITGLTTALAINQGGTAATTASGARASLSAAILGDNDDITSLSGITGGISTADYLDIDTAATPADAVGRLKWSSTEAGPEIGMGGGNVTLQIGQEELVYVLNKTGSAFTDMHVVRVIGAQGNRLEVALAQANNDTNSASSLAVVTEPIANNQQGFATRGGLVHNVDTSAFAEGAMLFLSPSTPGAITSTVPTAPDHAVRIGWCVRSHATVGSIYVHIQNGYEIGELHDVVISSPTNNQVLAYDSTAGVWKNTSAGSGTGDVVGPASATDGAVALFDGTTGKLLKNGVVLGSAATTSSSAYATAAQGAKADSAVQTETDPIYVASSWYSTTNNSTNWNTAYGWGNHASAGYLTTSTAASTYAPLTGTGASGTWGISISGNAATATNVAYSGLTGTVPTWNQNTTGSAATLTTGRTIAITGDLTYTSDSFNGSANVTGTGTLATVNSNVGSYGSSTAIPVVTVNAKGLVTAVSTATVAGGQYFGSAATKAIAYNSQSIAENVTVTTGNSGLSAGPITISSGYTVTVQSGSRWVIV